MGGGFLSGWTDSKHFLEHFRCCRIISPLGGSVSYFKSFRSLRRICIFWNIVVVWAFVWSVRYQNIKTCHLGSSFCRKLWVNYFIHFLGGLKFDTSRLHWRIWSVILSLGNKSDQKEIHSQSELSFLSGQSVTWPDQKRSEAWEGSKPMLNRLRFKGFACSRVQQKWLDLTR